ncbi:MAG: putative aminohydrolase SsnA [Acidobacteriota bacterium]|nr:putative aminohydrolase SsnA [Acidobacteriota bacterium]
MLITNATLITWGTPNQILEKHALYLEANRIVELGLASELEAKYPQAERLDARGQFVMPGNICAHTHFYGAFARGMAIPGAAPKDFPEILERLWWRLDKALTLEDVRYSALVCLIDAIKHGTTTLIDHHASPNAIDGSLDVIAEAVAQTGLRACLCYEVTDRDGAEKAKAGIKENLRFLQSAIRNPQSAIRNPQSAIAATFGLHASLTLSDATLEACRSVWNGGFHIHAAEHESDQYDSLQKSGTRVIDRLHRFGILGNRSIVAHAVHIDAREAALLAETGTWVTHQPRSNMNNAVGAADVESLLRLGVKVCLGNDGFSNAMWDEWKAAYLSHKAAHRDPRRMNGATVAEMAMTNNAALANVFFPQAPLGVLAPGAFADIIFVDYHPTTPLSAGNLPWHILFGFENSMVTTTICASKVLMKDRQLLFLNEAEITAKSRELAQKVWTRI